MGMKARKVVKGSLWTATMVLLALAHLSPGLWSPLGTPRQTQLRILISS
jgi:hypothetical protein